MSIFTFFVRNRLVIGPVMVALGLGIVAFALLSGDDDATDTAQNPAVNRVIETNASGEIIHFADFAQLLQMPPNPEAWLAANEGGVGRVLQLDDVARERISEALPAEADPALILRWYQANKYRGLHEAFAPIIGNDARPEHVYADQAVSIFRTFLHLRGVVSRPVVFEYTDGLGGGSHTFAEVWDGAQNKWLYFDPHYFVYAPDKSMRQIISGEALESLQILPTVNAQDDPLERRQQELNTLLAEGWQHWLTLLGPNMQTIVYRHTADAATPTAVE